MSNYTVLCKKKIPFEFFILGWIENVKIYYLLFNIYFELNSKWVSGSITFKVIRSRLFEKFHFNVRWNTTWTKLFMYINIFDCTLYSWRKYALRIDKCIGENAELNIKLFSFQLIYICIEQIFLILTKENSFRTSFTWLKPWTHH